MLSFILTMMALTACGGGQKAEESSAGGADGQQEFNFEMPEANLEGIPDIVAKINDVEITKAEFETTYQQQFQQAALQSQMLGQELDQEQLKKQVAEGMVGQQLLTQEANKRNSDVSEESINATLDELATQSGVENRKELLKAFNEQGLDEARVRSLVKTQVKIDQLVAEEAGDIEPTEAELEEAYEMIKTQQQQLGGEQELPSFEEIKAELVEQVKYQKEAEATQTLVEKLHETADVTIFL
ncbi:hypothetical protein BEP19_02715 [Ammoniphilus oxalaticus]|uniref:peptidylprolyl isomerase n=2 Tax=Ammoniphilus oxalaticus TaxID=66863 RepID=A0A419SP64_9BACL|nr:hypothetical protein BEP19_02715 [Ammoniphilus oxalaticus]